MKSIVLCGFMGSGKTTVGRLLGRRMKLPFLDLDDVIRQRQGMSVPEIFAAFGEAGFRDREHNAIAALCGEDRDGIVLATGGGALTFQRNLALIRESGGEILFLNPGFEVCYSRIAGSDRPLVRAGTKARMEELYRAREPLYRAACHREISMSGPPEAWVEEIMGPG